MAGKTLTTKKMLLLVATLAMSGLAMAQAPQSQRAATSREAAAEQAGNVIFTVVEQAPEFPGGMEALYQFVASNIKYPNRDICATGRVIVSFVIEKDGTVSNAKVVRDIGGGQGDEALRVVKLMPKWKPGRQNGKPVRVQFNLPVNFNLQTP